MQKVLPFLVLLLAATLSAEQINLTGNQNEPLFQMSQSQASFTEFTFQLPSYLAEEVDVNGVDYQRLSCGNGVCTVEPGLPELPIFSTMLAIPATGSVSVELLDPQYATFQGMNIYPSQGVNLSGETRGFIRDEAFYGGRRVWNYSPVTVSEPAIMRGVRVVSVTVQPFTYNPATGELSVMQNVTIRVNNDGSRGENEMTRTMPASRCFEKIYASHILNWEETRDVAAPFQARSILIIYPNSTSINDYVAQIADWKRTKGFDVTMVTTTETGTSNSNILNYIQNAYNTWENPPEYIILVGDVSGTFSIPTWYENFSYYNGEGDYPYTLLDGNDYLPDACIGRISIESANQLLTFLSKMNIYERNVYMSAPQMYNQSLLVGDTYPSGLSCVITNKYVKEQILMKDPDHTFTEIYADEPNPSQMDVALNAGCLFFNYRGYIGMSNWGSNNINGLTNTNMLVNATIITCSTGSFAGSSNTELLFRAGSSSAPTGSVSSIGMATSGTHTQFNNILQGGLYSGIQSFGMRNMGEALVNAEVDMWLAYGVCATNYAKMFIHWCNQMGDPSMDIWVSTPLELNASYTTSIPKGQGYIDVNVTDENNDPLKDAWVTVRRADDDIFASGYTDASGQITLRFDGEIPGEVDLTVTHTDYIPHLGSFAIAATGGVGYYTMTIDDDTNGQSQGNGNGDANPGELIELVMGLKNWSSSTASGVTATITSGSPYISITDNTEDFGAINAGQTGECLEDFDIEILPDAPDGLEAMLVVNITDGSGNTWSSRAWLTIHGCDLDIETWTVNDGGNGHLDAGEQVPLIVTVMNNGECDLTGVWGDLYSPNGLVSEIDTLAYFGDIPVGGSASCEVDPFVIEGLSELVPGMTINLQITFFNEDGYNEVETLPLDAGVVTVNDAAGPDDYGYICYDSGDTGHSQAPTYEWIEISGIGTNTGMHDTSSEGDQCVWVNLPFTFIFYGEAYDGITISTNGWISFIETEQLSFRNWPIPGGLGPNAMIAAMWDDLYTTGGGVYYYYDDSNPALPCFVVQWTGTNSANNSQEKFEVILYDPAFNPAPTGDGIFKIQYATFNNSDGSNVANGAQGNYCTVGTESPDGSMGLQYSYNNTYATGARTITNNSALLFTTTPIVYPDSWLTLGDVAVHDENNNGFIEAGETIKLGVYLENIGLSASEGAFATFTCTDGYVSVVSDTSGYRYIESGDRGANRSYFEFDVWESAPNNRDLACSISISNADGTWTYPFYLTVHKPTLEVYSTMINDLDGNNNGVMDPGESGKFIINIANNSVSPACNVVGTLATINSYVTIETEELAFGDIAPGAQIQEVYTVSLDAAAPEPSSAWFTLSLTGDLLETQTFDLPMGIGDWGFEDDFEDGDGDFNAITGWQWGPLSVGAYSGQLAWATMLISNYGNHVSWKVLTPEFFIGENTTLAFWTYYDTEVNNDGGNVKISIDGGNTWDVAVPEGGYPVESIAPTNYGIPHEPAFSGNSGGWQYVVFDLDEWANNDVMLCWHFGSNSSVVAYGWAFDDIIVSGGTERTAIINGNVTLSAVNDPLEAVNVFAEPYTTHPDADGAYKLYVSSGTYDLTGSLRWYESDEINGLNLAQGDQVFDQDLDLVWLPKVEGVDYNLNEEDGSLTITWSDDRQTSRKAGVASRATTPLDDRFTYVQTNIWMRQETGCVTKVDSVVNDNVWYGTIDPDREYMFWVTYLYDTGESCPSDTIFINIVHDNTGEPTKPTYVTALQPNYPNPFNPVTTIAYSMAEAGHASVKVYNVRGQLVRTLVDGPCEAGNHSVVWNGRDNDNRAVSSGVYFYRLEAPGLTRVRKALLLK